MARSLLLLYIICVAVAVGSCTREHNPVPRRTAWPRPAVIDTVMVRAEGAPLDFRVNRAARTSSDRPGWLNVAYPMYGAVMYVTFTDVTGADVDRARRNRMERLVLNSGGRPGRESQWTNAAGFEVYTLRTEGVATPLQFVATDGRTALVSGAVYFNNLRADAPADSLAPVLDAIEGDINRCLNALTK